MGFKNFLHEYFTFNRRERNGVFVLLSIILLLIFYLSFADYFYPEEKIDFSKFEKEIDAFEAEQKRAADSVLEVRANYFAEDTIVSYSNDKKLFSYLKKKNENSNSLRRENGLKEFLRKGERVELNSADTTELKKIKGIGSVFAKRIVKFREVLGGFINKQQLLEIYGFDREKLDLIFSQITVDSSSVKTININSASVHDLEKHPYISKKIAVAIFTRRVTVGDYTDVKDIKILDLTDEKWYAKIAPYLSVE